MAIYVNTLLLVAAGLFRAALIFYGLWQDQSMKVKFTVRSALVGYVSRACDAQAA